MTDEILDRIQTARDRLCGHCHHPIPPDSPSDDYCDDRCQRRFHRARACEPEDVERRFDPLTSSWATPNQLPTDFVKVPEHQVPGTLRPDVDGPLWPTVFRAERRRVWHLRLDDGHRYVERDVPDERLDAEFDPRAYAVSMWQSLLAQLNDGRHTQTLLPQRASGRSAPHNYPDPRRPVFDDDTRRVEEDHLDTGFGQTVRVEQFVPRRRWCPTCGASVPARAAERGHRCSRCGDLFPAATYTIEHGQVPARTVYLLRIGYRESRRYVLASLPVDPAEVFAHMEWELISAGAHHNAPWLTDPRADRVCQRIRLDAQE